MMPSVTSFIVWGGWQASVRSGTAPVLLAFEVCTMTGRAILSIELCPRYNIDWEIRWSQGNLFF
jgi:hypothetical protein